MLEIEVNVPTWRSSSSVFETFCFSCNPPLTTEGSKVSAETAPFQYRAVWPQVPTDCEASSCVPPPSSVNCSSTVSPSSSFFASTFHSTSQSSPTSTSPKLEQSATTSWSLTVVATDGAFLAIVRHTLSSRGSPDFG